MSDNGAFDGLHDEIMGEMAESFFGERSHLDDLGRRLAELAEELRGRFAEVAGLGAVLHGLLLGEQGTRDLYATLGVDPEPFLALIPAEPAAWPKELPFALSACGRFEKLVAEAYADYQQALDTYYHGRHYPDPENPLRMRVTVHYHQLAQLAERLNERIAAVNASQPPSETLRFARSLDPMEQERRNITGSVLEGFNATLDFGLAMPPVDFAAFNLPAPPELPPPSQAKSALSDFLDRFCHEHKDAITELLHTLSSGQGS